MDDLLDVGHSFGRDLTAQNRAVDRLVRPAVVGRHRANVDELVDPRAEGIRTRRVGVGAPVDPERGLRVRCLEIVRGEQGLPVRRRQLVLLDDDRAPGLQVSGTARRHPHHLEDPLDLHPIDRLLAVEDTDAAAKTTNFEEIHDVISFSQLRAKGSRKHEHPFPP